MSKPGPPTLRRSGNFCGHSTSHLREEFALQLVGVSHESFSVRVFSAEIVGKIWVVGVGHPMVRVLPRSSVSRDLEWDFLRDWRRRKRNLFGLWEVAPSAERRESWRERVGEEVKRQGKGRRFDGQLGAKESWKSHHDHAMEPGNWNWKVDGLFHLCVGMVEFILKNKKNTIIINKIKQKWKEGILQICPLT